MSVQVSYKKQITLGIIGIAILLLIIEVIANVWWLTQIHCEFEQNEIFQNFDEIEKKQLCLDFYNLKTTSDEIIPNQSTDSITINNLGFRGPEFLTAKPLDTYRIFMVGGSTMFGAGATSDETTIPGYLQQILDKKDIGFDIEVVNAGIQGADSNSELKLIEQKLVMYSPDLMVVYDGWNDLRANNASIDVKENWKTICKFGKTNNFDVIITLQPIAGFGNKILTEQELKHANTGKDYSNNTLLESLPVYQSYAKNLSEIKMCSKTFDLRYVFDAEVGPIYWDQGHVSDNGNEIVARSLSDAVFSTVSESNGFSTFENDNKKTSPLLYHDREIIVNVELTQINKNENNGIKITTYDNTNDEYIQNVTYLLSISKNNENLLRKYFFAQDGVLNIDTKPSDSTTVQIIGEQQYAHNAYVTLGSKYSPDVSDSILTSNTQIQLIGPIFSDDGIYTFHIELRTIDNVDNWIFDSPIFQSEINISKDTTETMVEDKPSFQIKDFLQQILSNYKTPIMINEILN